MAGAERKSSTRGASPFCARAAQRDDNDPHGAAKLDRTVKRYIALGDSISIDEYPYRETGRRGLGAVSLFASDLRERYPEISTEDLTADGATTDDVLRFQLPRVRATEDASLVTITAGGNDLLLNLGALRPPVNLVEGIIERLNRIVDETRRKLPNATILLGTIYDPSDGTNQLYGDRLDREAEWLTRVNDAIRSLSSTRANVRLADIHRHFLGHGLTAPEGDRWYWSGLIFEPNARGAAEVRRLWLDSIR